MESNTTNNIIDITLEGAERTKVRLNGRDDLILELNLTDLGIIDRLQQGMAKLEDEMRKISQMPDDDSNLAARMKEADLRMREYVDYIFDYPVSSVCARYGTMYDPKDGKFRYEIIIDKLVGLYTDRINSEYSKLQKRMAKHTDKYIHGKK